MVLVRHGETEWSRTGRHTGRSDPPLTEEGERQALAVGGALRERSFALVLSSPLIRARETARLAGFEPELRDDLAEWDYGEYDGMTTPEIRERVPDWTIWRYGAKGGESVEQLAARADRVVDELLPVDGDALVFSHGHFLRVFDGSLARARGRRRAAVRARLRDAQHARLRARAARDQCLERAGG